MINPMDLTGKRILVTGASSGIGRQTAITLSQLGANVVLVARREEQLKETLLLLERGGHSEYPFDLRQIEGIEALVKQMVADGGPFDGYVHCAGVSTNTPLAMYRFERLNNVMMINFYAFFELVRVLSKKGNYGSKMSIVGMSSIASIKGNAAQTAYAASKSAVDGAMRCMAKELHGKGIRVNTVMPAMINTEMYRSYAAKCGIGEDTISNRQYLGIGEPEDVALAAAFLLSDAARFITGIQFPVDGGFTSS